MKRKEEQNAIKNETEVLNRKLGELNEEELKKVDGGLGMSNPVAGMPFSQAYDIAWKLGRGQYRGTWETMGALEFMEWWQESNPNVSCPINVREIFG